MRPKVTAWKTALLENATGIFGGDVLAADGKQRIRKLLAKIGDLTIENFFLAGALKKFPEPERKAMIERDGEMPLKRRLAAAPRERTFQGRYSPYDSDPRQLY